MYLLYSNEGRMFSLIERIRNEEQIESQIHNRCFNLIDYYCSCIENMNRRYNLGHVYNWYYFFIYNYEKQQSKQKI